MAEVPIVYSNLACGLFAAKHDPSAFGIAVSRTRRLEFPYVEAHLANFEILIAVLENGHAAVPDSTYQ